MRTVRCLHRFDIGPRIERFVSNAVPDGADRKGLVARRGDTEPVKEVSVQLLELLGA
jgi:hypothetical protein